MPEGPSMVIAKEAVRQFTGKKVLLAEGSSNAGIERLAGKKIIDFKSWGKHFLICFDGFAVRIHFLLFGSYRVNERTNAIPKLRLIFKKGELNFYACAIKLIEEDLDTVYDWTADLMNEKWDPKAARKKVRAKNENRVCDILLDQQIFSGVGNIIKNEVLFRIRLHPETKVKDLSSAKLAQLVTEARIYSFDFLSWKKEFVLKKHWKAYARKVCPRDGNAIINENCGNTKRRTFFCEACQVLYKGVSDISERHL